MHNVAAFDVVHGQVVHGQTGQAGLCDEFGGGEGGLEATVGGVGTADCAAGSEDDYGAGWGCHISQVTWPNCHLCNIVIMMMKKALAISMALCAGLSLAACGSDKDDKSAKKTSSTSSAAKQQGPMLPTAADLAAIMNRAVDPNVPTEAKVDTVVGGESAPQLFDALTRLRADTGAQLQVVEPVLPGIIPTQANATMTLTTPPDEPIVINDVQFNYDNGKWKLDQKWACTLVQNVLPDQVPEMCMQFADEVPPPAPDMPPAPAPDMPPAPAPNVPPAPDAPPAPEIPPAPPAQ